MPIDEENPDWTAADIQASRLGSEVLPAVVLAAFAKPARGRPKAQTTKVPVKLRLDPDVIEGFKAKGHGWQTAINAALRTSLKLDGSERARPSKRRA